MPCRPIALSIPDGVSTMRGGGCPSRSARNRPLTATPPSVDEIDDVGVLDAVAEAAAGGDERVGQAQPPMATERSGTVVNAPAPPTRCAGRRTPGPRYRSGRSAAPSPGLARQDDAAVAAAEAAAHHLLERDVARPPVRLGERRDTPASSASGRRRRDFTGLPSGRPLRAQLQRAGDAAAARRGCRLRWPARCARRARSKSSVQ